MDTYKRILGWLWKPTYYYIKVPVSTVAAKDIYIVQGQRESYLGERKLIEFLGEPHYEILRVADEPELAMFARMTYGNSYSALTALLSELRSEKMKWIGDDYRIKVFSGNVYEMKVFANEFSFQLVD